MKITKTQLKQMIKEELEVTLTNEEAGELFGEELEQKLSEMDAESEIDEGMEAFAADLDPEKIRIIVDAMIQVGYNFGAPLLAALLARLGYEAAATATAQDALKRGDKNFLVNFLEDEVTGYKDSRG